LKSLAPLSIPLDSVVWKYGKVFIPRKSAASITALFDPFCQAVQVSTWPIGVLANAVPESAVRTFLIYEARATGPAPTERGSFINPVGVILYRSSDPTEIPLTRLVNSDPYCLMADCKAAISLSMISAPEDAHIPNISFVFDAIAAGMAEIGLFLVPP